MPGRVAGYSLRDLVSHGGHANVWRAEAVGVPGRLVAIKRFPGPVDPAVVDELRREMDVVAGISHPGLLPLLDVVRDGDGVALVTAFATGGSLASSVARAQDGLPADVIADLAATLGAALETLHDVGILHGDVRPANVLFDGEGRPMLGGLGTARALGTPATDPRHDLAALAAMLSEVPTATGRTAEAPTGPASESAPPESVVDGVLGEAGSSSDLVASSAPSAGILGARPGQTTPGSARRTHRRLLLATAPLIVLLAVGVLARSWGTGGTADRVAAPACAGVVTPDGLPGEIRFADLAGSGCSVPIVWDGARLTVPDLDGGLQRFELAADPDDVLLFADLDCDGRDAAILYRPATGELFRFDALAGAGESITVVGEPTGVVDGTARVVTSADGCDRLRIDG